MSDDKDMDRLDDLFAQARAEQPVPSDAVLSRIAADAAAWQPEPAPRHGFLAELLEGIGGWPALGGLVTATMAGLYLGFAQPELVSPTGLAQLSETGVEDATGEFSFTVFPGDDLFFEEG